ncbi:hypothetical protein F528_1703 [Neisseria meningitidis 992008]|nr:hypothetical protein F528_1703 [Neisseria meningitidis 992008]
MKTVVLRMPSEQGMFQTAFLWRQAYRGVYLEFARCRQ